MIKIKGSGSASGSISQRHGSADPDQHQHWWQLANTCDPDDVGVGAPVRAGSGWRLAVLSRLVRELDLDIEVPGDGLHLRTLRSHHGPKKGEDGEIHQHDTFQRVPSNTKLLFVFVHDMIPQKIKSALQ